MCTDRVEMDIPDEFFEVNLFLTDDRLVAVLEQVAGALVGTVEPCGIAG